LRLPGRGRNASCITLKENAVGDPRTGHCIPGVGSPAPKRKITSLDLLATLLLTQPRTPLVVFAAGAHGWLMFNLMFTRTP